MKLVDLAKEVLSEHESLLSEWKMLNQLIFRVREIDEKRDRGAKKASMKPIKIFQNYTLECFYLCQSLRFMN